MVVVVACMSSCEARRVSWRSSSPRLERLLVEGHGAAVPLQSGEPRLNVDVGACLELQRTTVREIQ